MLFVKKLICRKIFSLFSCYIPAVFHVSPAGKVLVKSVLGILDREKLIGMLSYL